jgi:hypothetical protein
VYNDDGETVRLHGTDEFSAEQLDASYKLLNDDFGKRKLLKYVNPAFKYKTKMFREFAKNMNSIQDVAKTGGFDVLASHIKNGIKLDSTDIGYAYTENPHMHKILENSAATFDINNPAHHQAIRSLANNYLNTVSIGNSLINNVTKNLKAKNYDEFKNMNRLRELTGVRLGNGRYTALPVSDNHNMGKDPMDHIIKTAGERQELDYPLMRDAYMTFGNHGKKRGNMYDVVRQYETDGVHGADKSIKALGDDLRKKSSNDLVEIFHSMKPDTRERFASEIHSYLGGRSAEQFMNDNKEYYDKYKASMQPLKESFSEEDGGF